MKKAVILHHQGWADIINCIGLVRYCCKNMGYDQYTLLIRDGAYELAKYVFRDIENITILPKKQNDISSISNYMKSFSNTMEDYDRLFFGSAVDKLYNGKRFKSINGTNTNFCTDFYERYGIDRKNRIEMFEFKRDLILEDKRYKEVVNSIGENYIVVHCETDGHSMIHYNKKIKDMNNEYITNKYRDLPKFNLDKCSNIFFDMIKVMNNAKEIHIMESVWCSVIYLLQKKYDLLKDVPIIIHNYIRPRGLDVIYPDNGWEWI
jgi:uncharacterized protein YozE (UPF0346 family)